MVIAAQKLRVPLKYLFFVQILLILSISCSMSENILKFKNIKCEARDSALKQLIYSNLTCLAKNSIQTSTFNIHLTLRRPINEFYVS